jgi:hypothetical protein
MSAIETYDCKVPGCTNIARSNRGPHAYLCDEHITRPPADRRLNASNGHFAAQVKELTAAGRRLDKAKAARDAAQVELAEAKKAWNQLIDSIGFVEERDL